MVSAAQVTKLPADAPLQDILDVIRRDGVIVLTGYVDSEFVDALNKDLLPMFDEAAAEGPMKHSNDSSDFKFRANSTVVAYNLLGRSPRLTSKLLCNPTWNRILEEFIPQETWQWMGDRKHTRKSGVQLHTSIAYRVRPGAENQVLHRDHGSCNIQRTGPTQQTNMISTFVAGTKVTIQNGGTRVIPGSHLWPQSRSPQQEEAVSMTMEKGDLALWRGDVFHGAGANTCDPDSTDATRILYGNFACADNFRAGENALLGVNLEDVLRMPPRVLKLLGYKKSGAGGGTLMGKDPMETYKPLVDYKGGEEGWDWSPTPN